MQKTLRLRWLLIGALIVNTASSFIWPLTTVYMHDYLHKSLTVSGWVLFFYSIIMVVGNYLGGFLFDRWSRYKTMLVGVGLMTINAGLLIFYHMWPFYAAFLILLGLGNGIVATGINSYATVVHGYRSSYIFNVLYFMNNLGLVLGTLLVGIVLPYGIADVFTIAFVLFILFIFVVIFGYHVVEPQFKKVHCEKRVCAKTSRSNTIRMAILMLVVLITWVAYEQWQSNISSYMLLLHMTIQKYSFVWTFNAILIVLFQPVLTGLDKWLLQHLMGRMYVGFLIMSSSFIILLFAKQYHQFLASMALLTIGEITVFPAVSTFVDRLASIHEKGKYQGYVNMFASIGRAIGPLVGAQIIDYTSSYRVLFLCCVVVMFAFSIIFITVNTYLDRKQKAVSVHN